MSHHTPADAAGSLQRWTDITFILVGVLQASKLSLHTIEDNPAEELPVLTPAELDQIKDANVIMNKMITLETQSSQMKPNLGAIAEYRKKVRGYEQACRFKSVAKLNLGRGLRSGGAVPAEGGSAGRDHHREGQV